MGCGPEILRGQKVCNQGSAPSDNPSHSIPPLLCRRRTGTSQTNTTRSSGHCGERSTSIKVSSGRHGITATADAPAMPRRIGRCQLRCSDLEGSVSASPLCTFAADWTTVDPMVYLTPFLSLIKASDVSGPITGAAAVALQRILNSDLISGCTATFEYPLRGCMC
jgi:hypothetical protein